MLAQVKKRVEQWKQERLNNTDIEILRGYPAYSTEYCTIYYNRAKRKWTFEWDDLFADPRPSHYPLDEDIMVVPSDSYATAEEISRARELLHERRLG